MNHRFLWKVFADTPIVQQSKSLSIYIFPLFFRFFPHVGHYRALNTGLALYIWECSISQLCPTLWDLMDCSLPGSSVHGIFQARILEWAAISYSRGSSRPRDWTHISCISCIGRWIFYHWAPGEPMLYSRSLLVIYFTHSSVHRSIQSPNLSLTPEAPDGNCKFVFYICDSISAL